MSIRDYIGAISRVASEQEMGQGYRRLMLGTVKLARQGGKDLAQAISGVAQTARMHEDILATWADPDEIGAPDGRTRFDACDLRIWLDLAERAGVPAIPAREVARLEAEELDALLSKVKVPESVRSAMNRSAAATEAEQGSSPEGVDPEVAGFLEEYLGAGDRLSEASARAAYGRIESALDEIPASWMVRTQFSGSGNLKALVGTGLMLKADDTARIRPDFELGGGWVRSGNRRMIDISDPRFLQLGIGGHKDGISYLARPWAQPARFHEGEDLHRANSPLAGPGKWPAEWRVFVRDGAVTGVANYYGWTGEGATPENAWNAVQAGVMAQRIVDAALDMGLAPHFMNQDLIRAGGRNREAIEVLDEFWPEDGMHCTLDFLESEDGMVLLEGGPANMVGGGGHPCAFAGQGADPRMPNVASCEGVAYSCMPHVHLGEPKTWVDGDPQGNIEGWDAALERARDFGPLPEGADRLSREVGSSEMEP